MSPQSFLFSLITQEDFQCYTADGNKGAKEEYKHTRMDTIARMPKDFFSVCNMRHPVGFFLQATTNNQCWNYKKKKTTQNDNNNKKHECTHAYRYTRTLICTEREREREREGERERERERRERERERE